MNNNSNTIALSAAVLVTMIAIAGITYYTWAADNNANNTASGTPGFFRHMNKNLTPEQKSALQSQWEVKNAQFKAKNDAIKAALDANDYNAWVKAVGEGAPILEKINQDNFSKLVEANGYMEKAQAIMAELSIQGRGMFGFGGCHGFYGLKNSNATSSSTTPDTSAVQ